MMRQVGSASVSVNTGWFLEGHGGENCSLTPLENDRKESSESGTSTGPFVVWYLFFFQSLEIASRRLSRMTTTRDTSLHHPLKKLTLEFQLKALIINLSRAATPSSAPASPILRPSLLARRPPASPQSPAFPSHTAPASTHTLRNGTHLCASRRHGSPHRSACSAARTRSRRMTRHVGRRCRLCGRGSRRVRGLRALLLWFSRLLWLRLLFVVVFGVGCSRREKLLYSGGA